MEKGEGSDTIAVEEEGVDGLDEGSGGVCGEDGAGRVRKPVVHAPSGGAGEEFHS